MARRQQKRQLYLKIWYDVLQIQPSLHEPQKPMCHGELRPYLDKNFSSWQWAEYAFFRHGELVTGKIYQTKEE